MNAWKQGIGFIFSLVTTLNITLAGKWLLVAHQNGIAVAQGPAPRIAMPRVNITRGAGSLVRHGYIPLAMAQGHGCATDKYGWRRGVRAPWLMEHSRSAWPGCAPRLTCATATLSNAPRLRFSVFFLIYCVFLIQVFIQMYSIIDIAKQYN